jgi:hypothetical protein
MTDPVGSATSECQESLASGNSLRLSDHASVGSKSKPEHSFAD